MVDMDVVETSGVDHPAHGYEGWLVRKSASADSVSALNNLLKKGAPVPQKMTKEALLEEVRKSKAPEAAREALVKAIDLQPDVDAAAELWQSLKSKLEAEDPETPSTEGQGETPPAAAAPAAPAAPGADLFKSVTDPVVRAALVKQAADLEQSQTELRKEREIRLDRDNTDLLKQRYPHMAIDHAGLAKSMRTAGEDSVAPFLEALDKAAGQLEAADMFGELGASRTTVSSAMAKANTLADGFVSAGVVKTHAEGVTKALTENPDLYTEYEKENR
jgi:hypothetical protein